MKVVELNSIIFTSKLINCVAEERTNFKDAEEKLKNQVAELSFRERVLMRRLAAKEQDMQEFAVSFIEFMTTCLLSTQ